MVNRLGECLLVIPLAFLVTATTLHVAKAQSTTADVFARMRPSIAIIANSNGVGSAFCVSSNSERSYYLTNAHVVGSDHIVLVYRQFPLPQKLTGIVVAKGLEEDPDLAIVRVNVGDIPALHLRVSIPAPGDAIADAGYPSAQYTLAKLTGDLAPAIHVGTVSAIVNRGGLIEFDAQAWPGNSGGPLFDPTTGDVVGVVVAKLSGGTEANVAIGIAKTAIPFLTLHSINYTPATVTTSSSVSNAVAMGQASASPMPAHLLRALPGADRVLVVYDTSHARGDGASDAIIQSAQDFAAKLGSKFNVSVLTADVAATSVQDFTEAARAHNALIVARYGLTFRSLKGFTNAYGTYITWEFKLQVDLADTYGVDWFRGEESKTVTSGRDAVSAIVSSAADLNDRVTADLYQRLMVYTRRDDSGVLNFFRYALPVPNGARRIFLSLSPETEGARVSYLPDFSVAKEAGLQLGDIVTAVNGTSTAGKTQEQLSSLLYAADNGSTVDLEVVGADGRHEHITFVARDLPWYVERRKESASSQ